MTNKLLSGAMGGSALAVLLLALQPTWAGPATDLAARMEELMQGENYARGAEVGEQFLREFPTGGDLGPDGVYKVRYNLAWCYYLTANYPKAIAAFQELASEKVPSAELREQATQLIGDCYSRYAGSLQDPKEKKDNYTRAVETYTRFISSFPKSGSLPDVLYGRGLANFRLEKYEEAARDLREVIERFPQSEIRLDTEYLLATVLGTHGTVLRKTGKTDEALKYLEASRDLFKRIIASPDVALANDAAYAAGEIFVQLAKLDPREYETAISYYRSVRSRDEVLASQENKVALITRALSQAAGQGDKRRTEQLKSWRMKELSKLREIQASPDLLLAAYIRIADCFFQQKKFDEARVMYRFLLPHARLGDKEVARAAAAQIVATHIGNFRPADARAAYEEFEKEFGTDPLAESFGLAIGDLFLRKGQATEALALFDKALADYPDSALKPMVLFRRAQALDALGRHEEAAKEMDLVLKDENLRKEASAEIEYSLGKMLRNMGKFDEAIKHLNVVVNKYPDFELMDDVHYQIALCYRGKGRQDPKQTDRAIEALREFARNFEGKSPLVVPALYQIGQCYEDKGDIENAVKTYRELAARYKTDKLAPYALYQVAIVYYNHDKWEEMVKGFQDLIQTFPDDALVCDGYFWIGFKHQRFREFPKAVEWFEKVVQACHDNPLASDAQYRIGNCWQSAAEAMGRYKAQDKDKQPLWREHVARAAAAYEKLLAEYPNSPQMDAALDGLTALALLRVNADLETPAQVDAYFRKLSASLNADPVLASRPLLCLASVYFELNRVEEALAVFATAFESAGDATLPAKYYDQYAELLTREKRFDDAIEVYLKMEEQFKDDPQTQANAVWGLGNAYLQGGAYEKAVAQFDRLINEFPWHKHAADAQFGKGNVLEAQGRCDEAIRIYEEVTLRLKGDARVRALLGTGRCLMKKNDYAAALKKFQEVSFLYEKFEQFASEALWLGGQCAEKLASSSPAEAERNRQLALQQYRDLIQKYPRSRFVEDARKRLGEMAPSR